MSGNTKLIVGLVAVAAVGAGLFIVYKKKPEWLGIRSNPNSGNPAVGAAPTVDKTAQRVQAGASALDSGVNAYKSIFG
jgi:hypothetical protein